MVMPFINIATPGGGAVLTSCVTGANHREKDKPCQDASLVDARFYKGHPYVLLAVADGHGADKYPRSEIGSHFAVHAASEAATRWIAFATDCQEQNPASWAENASSDFGARYARWLLESWRRQVHDHAVAFPLSDASGESQMAVTAYGTTIAVALFLHDHVFLGGIGDSSVHVVHKGVTNALSVMCFPEHSNSAVVGLGTDSLVSDFAEKRWQHRSLDLSSVRLLCLSTDGLADSLANVEDTLVTLARNIDGRGLTWLSAQLPRFLEQLTTNGVGDDIAAVLYVRQICDSHETSVAARPPSPIQPSADDIKHAEPDTLSPDNQ